MFIKSIKTINLNIKGFSHIELILVILVVSMITGIGLYVVNRSKDKSSQAESSVLPVPVYEVAYYYPGTRTINQIDYVVGTKNLKRAINSTSNNNVVNRGVAFLGFPDKQSVKGTFPTYKMTLAGGGKRSDVGTLDKQGVKTVILTSNKATKNILKNKFGFKVQKANIRLLEEKSPFYDNLGEVKSLYKSVTNDKRRLYKYTVSSTQANELKRKGKYVKDQSLMYGPSIRKYCRIENSAKFGEICKVKNYRLPDFAKFEEYIRKAEEARRLAEQVQQQSYDSDDPTTTTGGGTGGGGTGGSGNSGGGYRCVAYSGGRCYEYMYQGQLFRCVRQYAGVCVNFDPVN